MHPDPLFLPPSYSSISPARLFFHPSTGGKKRRGSPRAFPCRKCKALSDWAPSNQKETVSTLVLKRRKRFPSQQLPRGTLNKFAWNTPSPSHSRLAKASSSHSAKASISFPRPFQLNFKEGFREHVMTRVLQILLNHNTLNERKEDCFFSQQRFVHPCLTGSAWSPAKRHCQKP